jgi:TRAP-type C4-dicarboxylate transport system substrate-binding protein
VQKYYVTDQHTLSLAVFVVNEDWFQKLPADIRTRVKIAGKIASVAGRGAAWTNNKLAQEFIMSHGMKIYHPTSDERAQFRKLAQPAVLEWMRQNPKIDNKLIDELLQAVQNAEKELGIK